MEKKKKTPTEMLKAFTKCIEPVSSCCQAAIEWFHASGFGAFWMRATYGRCKKCGKALTLNGNPA